MSKVTVIGAGNVGATAANVLVLSQIADEVVLLDIKEGVSEGKAMDIMQTANILKVNTVLKGVTNDYAATAGSDVVVITSGIPRKPGMTREELIGVNAGIVKSVVSNVIAHSPNAIIVCVSNPMDTMTYLIHKTSGLPKNRIIGMGGATLTGLLGTSAWYAPGAAAAQVVKACLHNEKLLLPCSALLEGEYGHSDVCVGVPVILGKEGIEKVVEIELTEEEKALFDASVAACKKTNAALEGALN